MQCSKCRAPLPPGAAECRPCHAPGEFSDAERGRMETDIRARVMWGDLVEDIRTDWLAKGAEPDAVRAALQESFDERQRHFRTRGLQDLAMGVGALVLGGGGIAMNYLDVARSLTLSRGQFKISLILIAIGCLGVFLTIRGVHRLLTGGAAEKSASDLSEID